MSKYPTVRDPLSKEDWKPDDVLFFHSEDYGNIRWRVFRGGNPEVVILNFQDDNAAEVIETTIPSGVWYEATDREQGRLAAGYVMTAAYLEDLARGNDPIRLPSGRCGDRHG